MGNGVLLSMATTDTMTVSLSHRDELALRGKVIGALRPLVETLAMGYLGVQLEVKVTLSNWSMTQVITERHLPKPVDEAAREVVWGTRSEQTGRPRMSDKAYENAAARRDELARGINQGQQRLETLRSELRGIEAFLDQWRKFAGVAAAAHEPNPTFDPSNPPEHILRWRAKRKNSKKEEVANAAREVILANGKPLSRSDLYTILTERGLIIEGADPEMVLSTMLWRSKDKIVRLPKFGYWVAERQPIAEDAEEQTMLAAESEDLLSE